jgi:thiol-disulfide isomerase/thioredoxin
MAAKLKNVFCTVALASIAILPAQFVFGEPTTQPAAAVESLPATQPTSGPGAQTGRTLKQISAELISVSQQIRAGGGSSEALSDAEKRSDSAPKLIPLLGQQKKLIDEYIAAAAGSLPPSALDQMKQRNLAMLYLLRDPKSVDQVDVAAAGPDSPAQVDATSTRILAQWLAAGKDLDAQMKLVDLIEKLDVAHPDSTQLTVFTFSLSQDAASDDLADRMMTIAGNKMTNKIAGNVRARMPVIQKVRAETKAAQKQLASIEGKPLVVTGKTPEGKDFTTADWKGKVVLVDFWATWCGPCLAELPRVKALYAKYHDKGLEIVSVSNDYKQSDLIDFTARNEMPWPELFDPTAAAAQHWNPTTLNYGIRGIPTMFLIDKKGICRTVEAREKMEDLVPTLLAE